MNSNSTHNLSKVLLICLISVSLVSIDSYSCRPYEYTYTSLVLKWPQEYCYQSSCRENWEDLTVKQRWVIDGFMPASEDLDFFNCLLFMGHDPHCYVEYPYNSSQLTTMTRMKLNNYWPELSDSNNDRELQWEKHGTCYLSIAQTLDVSLIGNQKAVFSSYYKDTVAKAKRLGLDNKKTAYQTKAQLAADLKISENQFYAMCEFDPEFISTVRVCYTLTASPGTEQITDCPGEMPLQCEFPIKVRQSWEGMLHPVALGIIFIFALAFY